MGSENTEYKKFPSKHAKIVGSDRLWIGQDHLLLVESTGISERYKRFYFKDIQAINLLKTKKGYVKIAAASILLLLLFAGASAFFGKSGFQGPTIFFAGISLVVLFYFIHLLIKGATCDCWMYSSVQKEKLTPVNTIKAAKKFLALIVPQIEAIQGTLGNQILDTAQERIKAKTSAILKNVKTTAPKIISKTSHRIMFILLLILGINRTASLFYRSTGLMAAGSFLFIVVFILCAVNAARQAGSALEKPVKTATIATIVMLILAGISGYLETVFYFISEIEHVQNISYDQWALLRLIAQKDPFEYPLILGLDIFFIICCCVAGMTGLVFLQTRRN